jgi:hypothetical protein
MIFRLTNTHTHTLNFVVSNDLDRRWYTRNGKSIRMKSIFSTVQFMCLFYFNRSLSIIIKVQMSNWSILLLLTIHIQHIYPTLLRNNLSCKTATNNAESVYYFQVKKSMEKWIKHPTRTIYFNLKTFKYWRRKTYVEYVAYFTSVDFYLKSITNGSVQMVWNTV